MARVQPIAVTEKVAADMVMMVNAMLDNGDLWDLDEVQEADVSYVTSEPTMYRVIRDGQAMQVSFLQEGDVPREPDHRGF